MLMSVEDGEVMAPKRFKVEEFKLRGIGDGYEYRLRDMSGVLYRPDQWFSGSDLQLAPRKARK